MLCIEFFLSSCSCSSCSIISDTWLIICYASETRSEIRGSRRRHQDRVVELPPTFHYPFQPLAHIFFLSFFLSFCLCLCLWMCFSHGETEEKRLSGFHCRGTNREKLALDSSGPPFPPRAFSSGRSRPGALH